MKRKTLCIIMLIIAIILLIAAVFAENWIFYLLTACLVFGVSMVGSRKMRKK